MLHACTRCTNLTILFADGLRLKLEWKVMEVIDAAKHNQNLKLLQKKKKNIKICQELLLCQLCNNLRKKEHKNLKEYSPNDSLQIYRQNTILNISSYNVSSCFACFIFHKMSFN